MTTDTGPTQHTRDMVRKRAEDCCELCGLWAVAAQVHHRQPRHMGGSSDPRINAPSNLVLFCAMCHQWVETAERAAAYQYGWLVPRGHDPAQYPFLLWGRWVYLTDNGAYYAAPEPNEPEWELF